MGRRGREFKILDSQKGMWPKQGLRLTIVKYEKNLKLYQLLKVMTISD